MSSHKKLHNPNPFNKSFAKPQSITTETRLSQSHVFNNSTLNNSVTDLKQEQKGGSKGKNEHQVGSSFGNNQMNCYLSNNIHNSENKEIEFLRVKNSQLTDNNLRLEKYVHDLEKEKRELLSMNKKYVDVVNRYYENQNKDNIENKNRDNINAKKEPLNSSEAHRVLLRLEKDHRNLVKHCLTMEEEIKNYEKEMEKFEIMKSQLRAVNHTSVKDLMEEIEQLSDENRNLKKHNNEITYELEKSRADCQKMRKFHGLKEKEAGDSQFQVAKMKSKMNTIKQESIDKANAYEARIYELEIKVEKLEKELRDEQRYVDKTKNNNKDLTMKHVENIHEYEKLQKSMTDILNKNRSSGRSRAHSTLNNRGDSNYYLQPRAHRNSSRNRNNLSLMPGK